jgi:hypothetical protein
METKGGLLINGLVVPVEGLTILNPLDTEWCRLDPGDYHRRRTPWVRQIIPHGTRGDWPQPIIPGSGPGKRAQLVADFWRGDPTHSAAQLVTDTDGVVACLCDLATTAAYHATVSNEWSIGIEQAQVGKSELYEATLRATARLIDALCDIFEIPKQMPRGYDGKPLQRLLDGGPDFAGVYGHRSNTDRRGRGDPGDALFVELGALGFESFDLDRREDLFVWKRRQAKLNAMGERLTVDGIVGPGTMQAMHRHGFKSGRELDVAVEAG